MTDLAGQPLFDRSFYDARYQHGYMEEWPAWKKGRIILLIKALGLPSTGNALDFGCGRGVFTEALGQALPGWTITGTDISEVALDMARRHLTEHRFIPLEAIEKEKYDFLFTHHVLEHVPDLKRAWHSMTLALKSGGAMLHVAPCGNEGSLEHRICSLRSDGFQYRADGQCFFFEDESHVRRLKSCDMIAMAGQWALHPLGRCFANHKYGSMDWITDRGADYVAFLCDLAHARDAHAREELAVIRKCLLSICQFKARDAAMAERLKWARKSTRPEALMKARLWVTLRALGSIQLRQFERQVRREWDVARHCENGSELYMTFRRAA